MVEGQTENIGIPQAPVGEVSREERDALAESQQGRREAASKLENADVQPAPELEGFVSFVAAKKFANQRILVTAGKVESFPNVNSPTGKSDRRRDGDVWADFHEGVLVTDNPAVIAFLDESPEKYRRANDPRAASWAQLKEGQTKLAYRDPSIPVDFNVDDVVYPEQSGNPAITESILAGSGASATRKAVEGAREQEIRQNAAKRAG